MQLWQKEVFHVHHIVFFAECSVARNTGFFSEKHASAHSRKNAATSTSDKMDKELARYIVHHFSESLSDQEKLGLKHIRHNFKIEGSSDKNDIERKIQLYKKIGWMTEEKAVLELLKGGQDAIDQRIAIRIMTEHPDKVFVNKCLNCGQLARTPLAKQCRQCGHSWR